VARPSGCASWQIPVQRPAAQGDVRISGLLSGPVLIVVRFTRAESVEHFLHLGPRFPRARRKSRHNRQEAVAGQSLKFKVGGRPHRGRTWHPPQQRNLAEPSPGPSVVTR
jgi:hypothetical protein